MKKALPYKEEEISESTVVRTFSNGLSQIDLVWHRDAEDRTVEVVRGTGWCFQRDGQLPQLIEQGDHFEISAGEFHRLIKGDTDLEVKVVKESKKKKRKKSQHPAQYDAPKGSQRDKQLKKASDLYKQGDIKGAAKIRREMEKKHIEAKTSINDVIEEIKLDNFLIEVFSSKDASLVISMLFKDPSRIDEKRKKAKKKSGGLSASVKKSLDKKADKRCLTRGSVYAEFRAGLAAFLSSGSRKGMTAHQWAHARVNSAQPRKKWAKVKKRTKCK